MYNGKELAAKPGTRVAGWGCAAILFPCEGKRSFFFVFPSLQVSNCSLFLFGQLIYFFLLLPNHPVFMV